MSSILRLPDLPKPAQDGTIRRWLKQPGDNIRKGEILAEIETERALVQIESSRDAQLSEISVPAGRTVRPGDAIAVLAEAGKVAVAAPKESPKSQPSEAAPKAVTPERQKPEGTMSSVIPILMPKAGNDMEEGTVVKWVVAVGQKVRVGDILFELETDKATMEIESEHEGTVQRIDVPEGETVAVHTPLAYLAESETDLQAFLASGGDGQAEASAKASVALQSVPPSSQVDQVMPLANNIESALKVTPILMPKAGNDMEEGTVVKWRVAEGQKVAVGDVLFELETDKATMEIESEQVGTVRRIVVPEGETVAVHTPLAYLGESDADMDAFIATQGGEAVAAAVAPPVAEKKAPEAKVERPAAPKAAAPAAERRAGRVKASPAARKMAQDRGVDLATLGEGSGPEGRILTADVLAAKAQPAVAKPRVATAPVGEVVRTPLSPMRKAIARNLVASVQSIPQFYMRMTFEADALMAAYKRQKKVCRASLNDLLVLAISRVMAEMPLFRSRIDGDEMITFPTANIGIAVGTEDDLRVPVVLEVDRMSLAELAEKSREIIQQARAGKAVNMGKGTFTISNLGMYDVDDFTAIINPPEPAILAVGASREAVTVHNGAIRATSVITVTLTSDHRLIDGLMSARFLKRLKEILEDPRDLEA